MTNWHGIEFYNLIGSSSGPDFPVSALGNDKALIGFVLDLKFVFF